MHNYIQLLTNIHLRGVVRATKHAGVDSTVTVNEESSYLYGAGLWGPARIITFRKGGLAS